MKTGPDPLRPPARRRVPAMVLAMASWSCMGVVPARAQAPSLRLELNRLEPRDGQCRVWMVANNPGPEALDPVRLDLVLFGRDGVAARRLAVDVGPLPAARTVVRSFDVAAQPCDGIGQVLMNDVLACAGTEDAVRAACTDRIVPASRIPSVGFEK